MVVLHISVLHVLWPAPCTCAKLYHLGNGNHGQLFYPQPHLGLLLGNIIGHPICPSLPGQKAMSNATFSLEIVEQANYGGAH